MNEPTDSSRVVYGLTLGVLATVVFGVAYGLSAELVGLTFSLPVVGVVGGWIIGTAVAYGTWGESAHEPDRTVRVGAAVLAGVGWLLGLVVAYVVSQALIPQAATGLVERLSLGGFLDYILGLDLVRLLHLLSLVLVTFMAWRSAR